MASAMFPSDHDCPVCHEEFGTESTLLPCNHRLCKKCQLSFLWAGGCPMCRASMNPVSWKRKAKTNDVGSLVDDPPTDLATVAIVESPKALTGSDLCRLCDQGTAATAFCIQCSIKLCKLCKTCAKAHGKLPALRDHVVEDLGEPTSQLVAANQSTPCEEHPGNPAEQYCWCHRKLVCLLCATTTHKDCRGKGVKGVDNVAKTARTTLRKQTKRLRMLEYYIQERTAELEKAIHDDSHIKTLKSDVMATFDRLHKTLDKRLQEIMTAIEEDEVMKEMKAEKSALDQQLSAVVSQVQIVDQLLDNSPDSALVGMMHELKARLDDLEKQPRPERASSERRLIKVVFDSQKVATFERDIAGLGQVTEEYPEHLCKCGTVISNRVQLCEECVKPVIPPGTQLVGRRVQRYIPRMQRVYGGGTITQQGTGPGKYGDGWVQVKWDRGRADWYRIGADGEYDVLFE